MSTRSIIALPHDQDGFRGRPVHFDGDPGGTGAEAAKILRRDGLDEAAQTLIHEHYSWAVLDACQSPADDPHGIAVPGYGIAYTDTDEYWWTTKDTLMEWAYVLQSDGVAVWQLSGARWVKSALMRAQP